MYEDCIVTSVPLPPWVHHALPRLLAEAERAAVLRAVVEAVREYGEKLQAYEFRDEDQQRLVREVGRCMLAILARAADAEGGHDGR